jgi:hypothetical protein
LPTLRGWSSVYVTAQPLEYWRIHEGRWFVDVPSGGIPYDTVERIVRVTRRMAFVERCARALHTADDISNVTTAPQQAHPDDGTHWVFTSHRSPGSLLGGGGGVLVIVRVAGNDVEFVRCSVLKF